METVEQPDISFANNESALNTSSSNDDDILLTPHTDDVIVPASTIVDSMLAELKLKELTVLQRSPEWFLLQKFRITSTISHALLKATMKSTTSPNIPELCETIGIN